jgi:hypothetical protein
MTVVVVPHCVMLIMLDMEASGMVLTDMVAEFVAPEMLVVEVMAGTVVVETAP